MDNHDVIIIIFSSVLSIVGVLAGFILKSQSDAIKSLWKELGATKERIGSVEVTQGKVSTSLEYICKSIDEIKEWIKHS